ncbi:inner membrane-spanning protein YciB [Hellea balneolensis]|uniref:inner membrane-spanning protein YciB n=1 Tax=Hellea balneolensis TaxID=287478 RepID=UPI000408A39D|nr:inner membrane-spanning protein YciB [Hellea balneolensis]
MENKTPTPPKKPSNFWIDFGPLLVFFGAFQYFKRSQPEQAMLWAAGIFAVVAVIALLIGWLKYKHISKMLIFSTVIIVLTAALAIFSGNKTIFYMKPTVINILFGFAVIGGIFIKKNVIKIMMGEAIELPDARWDTLAMRWGLFFFAMAALNEYIWRTQSEDFWATFKVFGFLPITFIFTLTQIPFIQKHGKMRTE